MSATQAVVLRQDRGVNDARTGTSERWWVGVEGLPTVGLCRWGLGEEADDFGVDLVGVSGGCGPHEPSGFGWVESPVVVGFVGVVAAVQRPEVARGGGAALLPRGGVVEVAALGGPGAGGEAAGLVAGGDVLGQLRRRQVPLAAEVEDHTRGPGR